jgi:hypothetical protein
MFKQQSGHDADGPAAANFRRRPGAFPWYFRAGVAISAKRIRRTAMPKDRNRPSREAKKPKADKKPAQTASTFLRPQTTAAQPAKPKDSGK